MLSFRFCWYLFAALCVGTLSGRAQNAPDLPSAPVATPAPLVLPKITGPIVLISSKPSDVPPPSPDPTDEENWCTSMKITNEEFRFTKPPTQAMKRNADLYIRALRSKIASNWRIPRGAGDPWVKGAALLIRFQVGRDGTIVDPAIMIGSGRRAYDVRALESITKSSPFPPVPTELESPLKVCFHFFYKQDPFPQDPLRDPFAPKPKPAQP